ncbi:MAG: tetratricopeptide repeat protein [Candidatus Thermoplasmatota archaeon]|nr:tetratricopeptide repeat protein [Candidatus Thermoplasmatota archaeon]
MGKEKGLIRVPVHRRIMLYLWDQMSSEEDYEVPDTVTQRGIGRELSLRQTHVSRALSELSGDGFVRSRTAHIHGEGRRKKVYFLTKKGSAETKRYTEEMDDLKLPLRSRDGYLKLQPVSTILKTLSRAEGKPVSLSDLVNRFYDGSEVHLGQRTTPERALRNIPMNERFFGRQDELKMISRWIEDEINFISVVSIAGQGKTSLLAEFASKNTERPVVWYTLDEWTRPIGILEDVARVFEHLGESSLMEYLIGPAEPNNDEAAFRLVKDLKRSDLVIILDDVHKNLKVMELLSIIKQRLLPGSRTTILTGSRIRPSFYGRKDLQDNGRVREIELLGLDPVSAGKLLTVRGVPREEHELAYRKTSGHPLALELYTTGSDIDGYLWEEVTRNLEPKEMEVLDLASIYRYPMPAEAFFPGGVPDRGLIDRLAERVLLRRFVDGNLVIHDLLKEHLRERMTPMEMEKYIVAAIDFLSTRGSEKDILHRIALLCEHDRDELTDVLLREGDFLVSRGHQELLDMVQRIDPKMLKGVDLVRYLNLFSELNVREGDPASADIRIKRALEECDRILLSGGREKGEVLPLVSKLLFRSGEISRANGVHSQVIEAQRKNVSYNRRYGSRPGLGKALNNLAVAYLERGEIDKALESFHEAHGLLEESGEPGSRAFVEASIADAYIIKRDHVKARKFLKKASSYDSRIPAINGKLTRRTGLCRSSLGDLEDALRDLQRSYASFVEAGDRESMIWVLLDLHTLSRKMKNKRAAMEYLERAYSGIKRLKGASESSGELLLHCYRTRFSFMTEEECGSIDAAARELADVLISVMGPKRSVVYLDSMIKEVEDRNHILTILKYFEKMTWTKDETKGSLVVSLRRAELLLEVGRRDEVEELLNRIVEKGNRTGFTKAVRKARSLLR